MSAIAESSSTAEVRASAESWRGRVIWPLVTVILGILLPATRLITEPRFFYSDDTERGSAGQWYRLGEYLLDGRIPLLDPSAWQAGNYWAEGQWALINPVQWIIALTSHIGDSPVTHATIVKLAFLALLALGVYALACDFGALRPWASLAGVGSTQIGFLVYMAAASWSTDLFNIALLVWVWLLLRRTVEHGRSPLPYLVISYLLITFGYAYGVLMLVVLLVESLVRHSIRRDRARIVKTLVASVWGGLLTLAMFVPAILTAPVTERGNAPIDNVMFLNADLTDLMSLANPWATGTIRSWNFGAQAGEPLYVDITAAPLVYLAWFLILFPLALPMSKALVKRTIPLLVVGSVVLLAVLGPSHLGALRWPLRVIPYLGIVLVILFAVAMSDRFPKRFSRGGVIATFAALGVTTLLTIGNVPRGWEAALAVMALLAVAIVAVLVIARFTKVRDHLRAPMVVAGAFILTLVFSLGQQYFQPQTPLPSRGSPDSVETLTNVLPDDVGDGIFVGKGQEAWTEEESWNERLLANLWYFSPTSISNLYTVLPFETYSDDLCTDLRGETCSRALETLWSIDESTGVPVADLASISTIVVMKASIPDAPDAPAGWYLAKDGEYTWLFVRDEPLPDAGGVSRTGEGTSVTTAAQSDTSVTFTVDSVGSDPRVVLSRLPYPGYSTSAGEFADPVRGWLLTVDVSDVAPGQSVTVDFRPPGFGMSLATFGLATIILVSWPTLFFVKRRREQADAEVAARSDG